ncbi:3'(2'),5'-bisphosphate nucleotidase CysQ [Algicella marina]|uniref:3'(2'),5'-bisphosphate nucleotidase CysQ n=1 Tax=Algicella marina TaxID=2683284 RepID=A0A6P1T679_9RHOB|nr:3'(2'),5'-bisphosphate nucleotidase CysQ [Algicella marina]QHQ36769.1 3'(2'),5'-bisphosphate nucleotidase CysQ [Algicella marina]
MPETEARLLVAAAVSAGVIAKQYFGRDPDVTLKADNSPVSEADMAVNRLLEQELRSARPEYGWLSEESPDSAERLSAERTFIVDPIDGTRAFLAGESAWGIAISVVEAGEVIAAAFHMPAKSKTYVAGRGSGAWLNGRRLQVGSGKTLAEAEVLINKAALRSEHWHQPPKLPKPHFRPSLTYRLCLVAEGRFDAALTLRDAWEWDLAPGDLICREAGATVTTRGGALAVYNGASRLQPGLIAAPSALHSEIRGLLRQEGGAGLA